MTTTNLPRGRNKRAPYVRLNKHLPEMHARYLAGVTAMQLAKEYGTLPDTVRRALRRYNPALNTCPPRYKDETGNVYGRLTVKAYAYSKLQGGRKAAYFVCECLCGSEKIIAGTQLRIGRTLSCGCKKSENKRSKLF